ncbi:MAG TPA: S24/S26 family peptidase [Desulfatiglandales bacterium]|nr:S24/S26 family peptidase [Desulfatiglandales bacterium]
MKSIDPTPALFIRRGGEVPLRGKALIQIMEAILDKGAAFRFMARGFSMWPFIKDKDMVTITPMQAGRPRLGDVVAFISSETKELVIHRVVGRRGSDYLTKGDNTLMRDEPVLKTCILGCVKKVEKNGKVVSIGLGPERILIALINRRKLLFHILSRIWNLISPAISRRKALNKDVQQKKRDFSSSSKYIPNRIQNPVRMNNGGGD